MTSCKHAWNIIAKLMIFTFTYFHLFISSWFLFYYDWFYLVVVWLLSVVIILYQVIFFVHGYTRSSQIQILTGNQLKRSQTKQVLKSHILCNYVSKENSNKAFPKSKMLFNHHTSLLPCEGGYRFVCSLNNVMLSLSK